MNMKSIQTFLTDLSKMNVRVWIQGDSLHCSAPEDVLTPELLARLTAHKKDILSFLQQATPDSEMIPRLPRNQGLPLSFAQERLWFLDRFEGKNPVYNIANAIRLSGNPDIPALEKSLNEIIRCHDILRTTFAEGNGTREGPVQIISEELKIPLPVAVLRNLSESGASEEMRRLITEESNRPFDLASGPLLRAMVLKTGRRTDTRHILILTVHHIIFDDWSMEIFLRDMASAYNAFSKGDAFPPGRTDHPICGCRVLAAIPPDRSVSAKPA